MNLTFSEQEKLLNAFKAALPKRQGESLEILENLLTNYSSFLWPKYLCQDGGSATPLAHAISSNDEALANLLIKYGADVTQKYNTQLSLLHQAIIKDFTQKTIQTFLNSAKDSSQNYKNSVLELAVKENASETIISTLLKWNKNTHSVDDKERIAILVTAISKLVPLPILQLLLDANKKKLANTNTIGLLILALKSNASFEVIKLLLDYNAHSSSVYKEEDIPLILAILRGASINILELLLLYNGNTIDKQYQWGSEKYTALSLATQRWVSNGDLADQMRVQTIIQYGANPNTFRQLSTSDDFSASKNYHQCLIESAKTLLLKVGYADLFKESQTKALSFTACVLKYSYLKQEYLEIPLSTFPNTKTEPELITYWQKSLFYPLLILNGKITQPKTIQAANTMISTIIKRLPCELMIQIFEHVSYDAFTSYLKQYLTRVLAKNVANVLTDSRWNTKNHPPIDIALTEPYRTNSMRPAPDIV